jgi:glycosyltransferase involved in cell wall biosynthesis
MKPLITALIDTHNHESYIEKAILSVMGQGLSAQELEIVVVDDGSTDGTASVVEKFAPQVKLIRKPNGGQASAFNAGFPSCRGEFISILDGDDWWVESKLRVVLEQLERNSEVATISHGHYEYQQSTGEIRPCIPDSRKFVRVSSLDSVKMAHSAWPFFLPSALTLRRKVLEWILPLPEAMRFMADTPIQIASMFLGTLVLDEPLFYYRQHSQNLFAINSDDEIRVERKRKMANLVLGYLPRMFIRRGVAPELVSGLLLPSREYWFQFDPPTRARFFWFLWQSNYWYRSQQTWRFTAWNYLAAVSALFFGYEKRDSMYEWRRRATQDVERWYRKVFTTQVRS